MKAYRSLLCGQTGTEHQGQEVTLAGWVRRRRDHGGLVFVDLWDYSGIVQVVFTPEDPEAFSIGESLRSEFVISVTGKVRARPDGTVNEDLKTGAVELVVSSAELLSRAETPPFVIESASEAKEDLRLRYRYLDLRRDRMQSILRKRHAVYRATRNYLDGEGFCEIETPILTKPTPEGARDFLVPSRLSHGSFYALPQSPQIFKQVLMCSGFDRYYQIVRCFRDEDFRANRQPEFTQIDMELSFVNETQVQSVAEGLVKAIWSASEGVELQAPFKHLSYQDALNLYGTDAPDVRFGMEMVKLNDVWLNSKHELFQGIIKDGGCVKGLRVEGGESLSRSQLDGLVERAQSLGAKGLGWLKLTGGEFKGPFSKFFGANTAGELTEVANLADGDLLLMIADRLEVANRVLGSIRQHLIVAFELEPSEKFAFRWIDSFPLFDYDQTAGRYVAVHHPFTSPAVDSLEQLKEAAQNPGSMLARAYDLVLNGQEIAGGSIRIHRADWQREVFNLLGITPVEAQKKFGFLLDALSFGAPPHGGIAFGLDRIAMILNEVDSIRDVIAFPKTARGMDIMAGAPAEADHEQLLELGVRVLESSAEN